MCQPFTTVAKIQVLADEYMEPPHGSEKRSVIVTDVTEINFPASVHISTSILLDTRRVNCTVVGSTWAVMWPCKNCTDEL